MSRELRSLQRDEARLEAEMRAAAKRGDNKNAREIAKQLVQLRKSKERLQKTNTTLGSVRTQTAAMAASARAGIALGGAASILKQQNDTMMRSDMLGRMREFAAASERMDVSEEMMDDTLASAFDEDEEEEDDVVREVLEEVGLDASAALPSAPRTGVGAADAAPAAGAGSRVAHAE